METEAAVSKPSGMNRLNGDLLMYTLSFLDCRSSGLAGITCRRILFILDKLSKYQPSLAVKASNGSEAKETVTEALLSMPPGAPNIAFAFLSMEQDLEESMAAMKSKLPKDCKILAAQSSNVQVNLEKKLTADSTFSLSLGSFPEAKALPFAMEMDDFAMSDVETTVNNMLQDWEIYIPAKDPDYYKVFVLNSCGQASGMLTEPLIKAIQKKYPKAAIIGGICVATAANCHVCEALASSLTEGIAEGIGSSLGGPDDVSSSVETMSIKELKSTIRGSKGQNFNFAGMEKYELVELAKEAALKSMEEMAAKAGAQALRQGIKAVQHGICGMAIGGNCPLRSVVSRGMRSVTTDKIALAGDNDPRPKIGEIEPYSDEVDFDEGYCKVRTLLKPPEGEEEEGKEEDNPVNWVVEPFHRGKRPQFIGIRSSMARGFALHPLSQNTIDTSDGALVLEVSEEVVPGAELDLFALDGESCIADLQSTLSTLRSQLEGEELISALMFSCGGRGPEKNHMLKEDMLDATYFERTFPGVPLLGYYAGGEIGPEARVAREDAFMCSNAAVQGFTAVFGVFIVPERNLADFDMNLTAEDTEEAWEKHSRSVVVEAAKKKAPA